MMTIFLVRVSTIISITLTIRPMSSLHAGGGKYEIFDDDGQGGPLELSFGCYVLCGAGLLPGCRVRDSMRRHRVSIGDVV